MELERHEYDVVVVGAGGAGLRAAIEAHENGARTAVVCKSLLGKAHTVMAEGGVAAAMGNVDDRDSWRVHFADTMRGGQYVNRWRSCTRRKRPRACTSWKRGRAVRLHERRPHPAAQLRRPPLSRLAHVAIAPASR